MGHSHSLNRLITFLDDFSKYGYIYLARDKIHKTKVEKKHNKKIKIVRTDRAGEFYGKYEETSQHKGHLPNVVL